MKYYDEMYAMTPIQKAAYKLIQSDARFIYSLVSLSQTRKYGSNYIMMSTPYIGVFADGAEQWCKKMNLDAPRFSAEEKQFYTELRKSVKMLENGYDEYSELLIQKFKESDRYFKDNRSLLEHIMGYKNIGVDICENHYCGNTILCSAYMPLNVLDEQNVGYKLKQLAVISGKLSAYFGCTDYPPYRVDNSLSAKPKDFHFYKNCPLKLKNEQGLILFSILCSINYSVEFLDKVFIDEFPMKFKTAYLLYYYLCEFVKELKENTGIELELDGSLYSWQLRNCIAHYGLGAFMKEFDVIETDPMQGLTIKAFGKDYVDTKYLLFRYLVSLRNQIHEIIL